MPTKNPSKLIDDYIAKLPDWEQEICKKLRRLIHQADPEIQEDWKWNSPAFSHEGLVCAFFGFREWVTFTFYQGALIEDKHKIFNYGKENDRTRSIKFTDVSEIQEKALLEYLKQAVMNNLNDKKVKIKISPKQPIDVPHDMLEILKQTDLLKEYEARTYYQQKGYVQWIENVKRPETRKRRIERMLQELRDGTYMPPQGKWMKK